MHSLSALDYPERKQSWRERKQKKATLNNHTRTQNTRHNTLRYGQGIQVPSPRAHFKLFRSVPSRPARPPISHSLLQRHPENPPLNGGFKPKGRRPPRVSLTGPTYRSRPAGGCRLSYLDGCWTLEDAALWRHFVNRSFRPPRCFQACA